MDKRKISQLINEFLLYAEFYGFSIRVFLTEKKIIYDDLLLEEIVTDLVKLYRKLYSKSLRRGN